MNTEIHKQLAKTRIHDMNIWHFPLCDCCEKGVKNNNFKYNNEDIRSKSEQSNSKRETNA